jgi:RNA polymerase sigma-70 factor (ECF subfamily)
MPTEDELRFTALYEETKTQVVAYVLRRTASREDAADVVAEAYEIAWRRLDVVPPGRDGLLWLFVTARYLLANRGRRLRRRDELVTRLAAEIAEVDPYEEAIDEEAIDVRARLGALPAKQREVLMLSAWEGLDAAAIGTVLGCSPAAARIRLHRARARLRGELPVLSTAAKRRGGPRHTEGRSSAMGCAPEEA